MSAQVQCPTWTSRCFGLSDRGRAGPVPSRGRPGTVPGSRLLGDGPSSGCGRASWRPRGPRGRCFCSTAEAPRVSAASGPQGRGPDSSPSDSRPVAATSSRAASDEEPGVPGAGPGSGPSAEAGGGSSLPCVRPRLAVAAPGATQRPPGRPRAAAEPSARSGEDAGPPAPCPAAAAPLGRGCRRERVRAAGEELRRALARGRRGDCPRRAERDSARAEQSGCPL